MSEKDLAILSEVTNAVAEAKGNDAGKLLSERAYEFPTDAMGFCHITAMIMEQAEDLYAVSRRMDRFSKQYLKLCKVLEKTVDHLGTAYITKDIFLTFYILSPTSYIISPISYILSPISYFLKKVYT